MTPGEMADRLEKRHRDCMGHPGTGCECDLAAAAMLREVIELLTWHREGDGESEPEYVAWCLHRDAWLEGTP